MLTLYATDDGLDFDAIPGADHILVETPLDSDVLHVRGEPLLFVTSGEMTRYAWTADDVYRAARDGKDGFQLHARYPARIAAARAKARAKAASPTPARLSARKRLERLREVAEWFAANRRQKKS